MPERESHERHGDGPDSREAKPGNARASEMLRLREIEHLTLREIGERYGLTSERVRQILNRHRRSLQSQSLSE